MRALVTGAAGYIGSHLVDELLLHGWEVYGLDAKTDAACAWDYVTALIGQRLQRGNVLEWYTVWGNLDFNEGFDVVFHLAAQSHVDVSLDDVGQTMRTNAVGTHLVAEACALVGVPMVYCSTDEVYGDAFNMLVGRSHGELDPLNPSSPYSAGKAAGELAVRAAVRSFGLRAFITRGCNAYGSRQMHEKLVPIACRLIQQGKQVPLHGGGLQIRQWVAVEEFAECLRLAGEWLLENDEPKLQIANIAGPERLTVRDLVAALAAEAGVPAEESWVVANDRPGQDRSYHVSGDKARGLLGFEAKRRITDELRQLLDAYPADGEVKLAGYV